ncbi:flagellar basal body rod protein [Lentibacillus salicampi]|uniref:Flagellar basal body rod protein n=1 Tax=Lentibacillus salicampi TaxID=175306 RepID=A0A4Y9A7U8_9BACI|nr:flagellar basal body rod protein [Lentibacillus salicampi]TFJ91813.1 flagellar basal body rod protein [Lentibacillus salicampi]
MKKFLVFAGGMLALFIFLVNLGPMILLGVSIWLLYVIFKQFLKSNSTVGKVGWIALGLLVLSIGISNIYAIIGVAAAYALYLIYKSWKNDDINDGHTPKDDDPFNNFERQWADIHQ